MKSVYVQRCRRFWLPLALRMSMCMLTFVCHSRGCSVLPSQHYTFALPLTMLLEECHYHWHSVWWATYLAIDVATEGHSASHSPRWHPQLWRSFWYQGLQCSRQMAHVPTGTLLCTLGLLLDDLQRNHSIHCVLSLKSLKYRLSLTKMWVVWTWSDEGFWPLTYIIGHRAQLLGSRHEE